MSMRLRIGQREDIKITPPEVGTIHYRLSKFKSFVALARIGDRGRQSQKILGADNRCTIMFELVPRSKSANLISLVVFLILYISPN
jgi:hypothetical protein